MSKLQFLFLTCYLLFVITWSSGWQCWLVVSTVRYVPRSDDCFNVFRTHGESKISDNWEHHPGEIVLQIIMTGSIAIISYLWSSQENITFSWWKMKDYWKERWRFVFIFSGQILATAVLCGGFLFRPQVWVCHLLRLNTLSGQSVRNESSWG